MGHNVDDQLEMINGMGGDDINSPLNRANRNAYQVDTPRSQMISSAASSAGKALNSVADDDAKDNINNNTICEATLEESMILPFEKQIELEEREEREAREAREARDSLSVIKPG